MTTHDIREDLAMRWMAGEKLGTRSAIAPADRSKPLPLSDGQRQLWFLNRLAPESPEYLVPMVLRLRGALDEAALSRVWTELVARHEILRTRYELNGDQPVQVIDPPTIPLWSIVDVGAHPDAEAEAMARADEEARRPFDLELEHPLRLTLVRIADDDHLMVAIFHHIASDQTSHQVLLNEIGMLYHAYSLGQPMELPPPAVQYADFAAWQQANAEGERTERHIAYWREQLAGVPRLELPLDRPRPHVRGWRGAAAPVTVSAETALKMRDLALEHQATPFMVMLTAFQCLLARYTGQDDVAVGTVTSGRSDPSLANTLGYMINNLVLRAKVEGSPSFVDMLVNNRGTVLDAFDHQDVPFARLVDELQPERDMSVTPLFQAAITMHDVPPGGAEVAGLTIEHVELAWQVAKVDLALRVAALPDGTIGGAFEYATDLFDESTANRIAGHFSALLDAIAANPTASVRTLDFLADDERVLVTEGSGIEVPTPTECLHQVFEAQAARTPGAPAVVYDGVALSYGELNEQANRLAHHLRSRGAEVNGLVGVSLDRDDHLVPTLLGIVKSGSGYLPLDPAYPSDRLQFMVEDAQVDIVVTVSKHLEAVRAIHSGQIVVLDADAEAIAAQPAENPEPLGDVENLAYVIYTSGSTGKPKGVQVSHHNVLRLFTSSHRHLGFGDSDVWSMFHSYAFDVSVWELWGALLHGGQLVVVSFDVSRSPSDFLALLADNGVTILSQTPSAFRGLVTLAETGEEAKLDQLALRAVVFAGEKLELADLAPWTKKYGVDKPALVNMYGITETTVHSTFHQVTAEDFAPGAGNPVGYPLDDLRIHLLDQHGQLVPIGVPGEIYVGGPGVTLGYLNRPELNAERFLADRWGPDGATMYRSGDLARRLPDGSLYFLGRIDKQVKLRGFRIELGEINSNLAEHPGVKEAVVVLRDDTGEKRLVAYLVPSGAETPDPGDLRSHLGKTLPEYMVPSAFVTVDAIPLTTNGKLDERALPAPDESAMRGKTEVVAPRTPTESKVAEVWQDVLKLETVSVHDGFFDVGGDSIRAVTLVGSLRLAGFEVAVRDVFEYRTIALLAEFLEEQQGAAVVEQAVTPFELISDEDRALLGTGIADAYPMSQLQIIMLVEMEASGEKNLYHNVSSFEVKDEHPFDLDALRAAGQILVDQHEILRTSLHLEGFSTPMQVVHSNATMEIGVQDLRGLSRDEAIVEIKKWSDRERQRKFNVHRPSLLRYFAHITDQGWWCSITECHPILEGWSYHALLMQLLEAYNELKVGKPAPPAPPAVDVRYADFVAAELKSLASEEDRRYHCDIVEKHSKFELPATWRGEGTPERFRYDTSCRDILADLKNVARRADVSLKAVIHAGYLKTMSLITDSEEFFTGLVCDTRPEILGAERVAGMYLNTVPFAYERKATTWRELLQSVFNSHVELWPHRRFPLPEVHREVHATGRLIDTFFIFLDFHVVDDEKVEADTVIDDSPNEFDLTVNFMNNALLLFSNTGVLSKENAARMMAMYRKVLEAMIEDLDGDAQATFLSADERELVLEKWNRTEAPLATEGVVERMRVIAQETPDAIAAVDDTVRLSYAELVGRASVVSARLAGLPIGSVVPILADPSVAFVTGVLGVQGAGCAYIPLDVAVPVPRTAKLLEDSGAKTLLVGPAHLEHAQAAVEGLGINVIVLDDEEHAMDEWTPVLGAERDLAYVIYTSGSTGMPKGAMVHREGMVNHLLAKVEDLEMTERDVLVQNAPLTFDVSVWQMLAPLVSGGQVRVVGKTTAADPAALFGVTVDEGVTILEVVPSLLRAALDDWDAGAAVPDLAKLRWLVATGEALPPELCVRWFNRFPHVPLVNAYGPTECSDDVTHAFLTAEDSFDAPIVPIGRAVRNTRLYVLDPKLHPSPIGIPGELYVGGVGVGLGYLNDPERTAQAFVTDPFVATDESGREKPMYRTGDRVRMRPDGQLEFIGRRDSQVKIRGQRVELGEVESALQAVPDVTDAAAKIDANRLVGYIVGTADPADVRRHLVATMPEHLVPSAIVVMEELPLTPNGKVDRKALPSPDRSALAAGVMVEPRNATEAALAEVWREVLGIDDISVEDDFFAIGGDSIRTLTLQSAMRARGFALSVRDVFELRTIAGLAGRLAEAGDGGGEPRALVWLRRKENAPAIFCVHPQGGSAHWFLQLADAMREHCSVAAFEAPASIGSEAVDLSALAAGYLREMSPDAPFYLLGWSSAATLTWEMAQQLADAGTPATEVILIDPTCDPAVMDESVVTTDIVSERLAELLREGRPLFDGEITTLLQFAGLASVPDRDAMLLQVDRMRALTAAMYTYQYSRGTTPVQLVVTDECEQGHGVLRGRSYEEYVARFTELAPRGLTVHRVPGGHQEILATRVTELTGLLGGLVTGEADR